MGRFLIGIGICLLLVLGNYRFPAAKPMAGPDSFGYVWLDNSDGVRYGWVEISGNGTDTGINGDDNGVSVSLGFKFSFYGTSHPMITISSNGYLTFAGVWTAYFNVPIPSSTQVKEIICPFWDDLTVISSDSNRGAIYYKTQGTEPNMTFIVEWSNVAHLYDSSKPRSHLTFEAILFQGSNEIKFQYREMMEGKASYAHGESATIGIQADTFSGLSYSYTTPAIHDGLAILFTPKLASPSLEIDPQPTIEVTKGCEFTIEIWVRDIPEGYTMVGLSFWVNWNPATMEYLAHTVNDHGWPYDQWVGKADGYLWFNYDPDTGHMVGGDDMWASITFRYTGEGSSLITIPARFEIVWLYDGENNLATVYPAPFAVLCKQT